MGEPRRLLPFDAIYAAVRRPEYYVPRDYKTIGGMWTVDTWVRSGVTVQLMDEGYTTRILAKGLKVTFSWPNPIHFEEGDEALLASIAELLKD